MHYTLNNILYFSTLLDTIHTLSNNDSLISTHCYIICNNITKLGNIVPNIK